jgi:hypothetical protein
MLSTDSGCNTFVLAPQVFLVLEFPAKLFMGCVSEVLTRLLTNLYRCVTINWTPLASQRVAAMQPGPMFSISPFNTFRNSTHDFFPSAASSRIEEEAFSPPN